MDRLDGLSFAIEYPSLSGWDQLWLSLLVSSELDVQGGAALITEEQAVWLSVDKDEFSILVHSKLLVEASLFFWIFRDVCNLPSLVDSTVLFIADDALSLSVFASIDVEYLLVRWILDECTVVLPDLPPVASWCLGEESLMGSATLHGESLVAASASDCLSLIAEVPDLGLSSGDSSLDDWSVAVEIEESSTTHS